MTASVSAIVVSRKQLGDLLLLLPAMEYVHQQTGYELYVHTRGNMDALIELMPCQPRPAKLFPGDVYSRLYCFESGSTTSLLSGWIRSRRKTICLTRPLPSSWQRRIFDEIVQRDVSAVYRGAAFHAMVGGNEEQFSPPALHPPPRTWMPKALPDNYAVIHPTAAWQRKAWDVSGWRMVIRELHCHTGLHIVLTAGTAGWETAMAGEIASDINVPLLNLAGRTSLREYLAVLSRATATLCIDGSASHLSAAFGRPTLTLFGPTNPVHWHWPTRISRRLWAGDFVADKKPPVSAIPHRAVLEAALELLTETSRTDAKHG